MTPLHGIMKQRYILKHQENTLFDILLVFLGGVFVQSALKEDWRIAIVGLGFSVFFTCLGSAILAKQKEKE